MLEENKLQVILSEQNIAKENAQLLIKAFGAPFEEAGKILAEHKMIVVTKEDDFALMAEARSKRLALKDIRVGVEKKRKELKEDSLKTGKAIDSVAKFVKEIIEPAEAYLEQQEKFAEIKRAERAAKIKSERIEKLMQYTDDLSLYNLDEMTEDQFTGLLTTLKNQHEAKIAEQKKLEDERIAKEKAEAEERERISKENERLRKEAEEREIEAAKERKAAEQREADLRAEREAEQKAAQAKLDEERQKREAIEAEQREERQKAEIAKREAEEQERNALLAPDKQKLNSFADALDIIRDTKLPAVKSKQAQDVLNIVEEELKKLSVRIKRASEAL
jgi:hypothetical protein